MRPERRVQDRRVKRSVRVADALRLQLEAVCTDAGLRAVVVADDDGLEVARAGDADECAELAAVAPIAARGLVDGDARERLAQQAVAVRAISIMDARVRLYVCAKGGSAGRIAALERAGEGARRILKL